MDGSFLIVISNLRMSMQKGIDWSIYLTTPKRVIRGREFTDWIKSRTVPVRTRLLAILVKLEEEGISTRSKYLRDGVLELKLEYKKIQSDFIFSPLHRMQLWLYGEGARIDRMRISKRLFPETPEFLALNFYRNKNIFNNQPDDLLYTGKYLHSCTKQF